MSRRTTASTSLNSLKKRCDEVDFQLGKQVLVRSSPRPSALLASAILCRALKRSEKPFLFSVCSPLETMDAINKLKEDYDHYSLILVGVDLEGKKRIRKGSGYPLLIGGELDSSKTSELSIGDNRTILAAAYAFAETKMNTVGYEAGLAAMGILMEEESEETAVKANKDIVEHVMAEKIIQEKQGFRFVGIYRLPLIELLQHSIRPFLRGLSGNREACIEVLDEADIPTPKYGDPLAQLTTKETQRLTKSLLSRFAKFDQYLKPEYMLPHEDMNSPIRSTSDTKALLETSWSLGEFGTSFAVLLGDRGATLRTLLDSHMKHRQETVSAVIGLQDALGKDTLPEYSTHRISDGTLTDVGRIMFELNLVNQDVSQIALSSESSTEIIWRDEDIDISQILRKIGDKRAEATTTSSRSLRFPALSETEFADILKKIA